DRTPGRTYSGPKATRLMRPERSPRRSRSGRDPVGRHPSHPESFWWSERSFPPPFRLPGFALAPFRRGPKSHIRGSGEDLLPCGNGHFLPEHLEDFNGLRFALHFDGGELARGEFTAKLGLGGRGDKNLIRSGRGAQARGH